MASSAPLFARLLVLVAGAAAQFGRCKHRDVIKPDGTYQFKGCTELSLFGHQIGDEGAASLGKALATDTKLKFLDIWANGIGPVGAEALGKALEANTVLEKIFANENQACSSGSRPGPSPAARIRAPPLAVRTQGGCRARARLCSEPQEQAWDALAQLNRHGRRGGAGLG